MLPDLFSQQFVIIFYQFDYNMNVCTCFREVFVDCKWLYSSIVKIFYWGKAVCMEKKCIFAVEKRNKA